MVSHTKNMTVYLFYKMPTARNLGCNAFSKLSQNSHLAPRAIRNQINRWAFFVIEYKLTLHILFNEVSEFLHSNWQLLVFRQKKRRQRTLLKPIILIGEVSIKPKTCTWKLKDNLIVVLKKLKRHFLIMENEYPVQSKIIRVYRPRNLLRM